MEKIRESSKHVKQIALPLMGVLACRTLQSIWNGLHEEAKLVGLEGISLVLYYQIN